MESWRQVCPVTQPEDQTDLGLLEVPPRMCFIHPVPGMALSGEQRSCPPSTTRARLHLLNEVHHGELINFKNCNLVFMPGPLCSSVLLQPTDQKSFPSAWLPWGPGGDRAWLQINPCWWRGTRVAPAGAWRSLALHLHMGTATWITDPLGVVTNKTRRETPRKRQFSCGRNCPPQAIKNISVD